MTSIKIHVCHLKSWLVGPSWLIQNHAGLQELLMTRMKIRDLLFLSHSVNANLL